MYRDLDEFLIRLEQANDLVYVARPVKSALEITAITRHVTQSKQNRALVFEQVGKSRFPVVTNLFGSPRRMAWALGVNHLDGISERMKGLVSLDFSLSAITARAGELFSMVRTHPTSPNRYQQTRLDTLPICRQWPQESHANLPQAQLILDGRVQRVKAAIHQDRLWIDTPVAEPAPAALVLGGDPAMIWAASVPLLPTLHSHWLAGWIRRRPVPLTQAQTQPLRIPANAEIVIEGRLVPGGGTATLSGDDGFYRQIPMESTLQITAITQREGAYLPLVLPSPPPSENHWLNKASEALLSPLMRLLLPEVIDFNFPAAGVFRNLAVVSVDSTRPGTAHKVMYGLWGMGQLALNRAIIVVDAGVDVRDMDTVARHVLQSMRIIQLDGPVHTGDGIAHTDGFGGKIGIDATGTTGDIPTMTAAIPDIGLRQVLWHNIVLIVAVGTDVVLTELWRQVPDKHLILVDADTDLDDPARLAWLVLASVDWRRDLHRHQDRVGIDARRSTKTAPPMLELESEMSALVEQHWREYGL